jgi:hypothetical protein
VEHVTWRRVAALISGLSPESRYVGAIQSAQDRPTEVAGKAASSYLASLVTTKG